MISMANKTTDKKAALNQFKMEAANEVGVTLKDGGYNGDLSAAKAGSVGGQMVKKMVESYVNSMNRSKKRLKSFSDNG